MQLLFTHGCHADSGAMCECEEALCAFLVEQKASLVQGPSLSTNSSLHKNDFIFHMLEPWLWHWEEGKCVSGTKGLLLSLIIVCKTKSVHTHIHADADADADTDTDTHGNMKERMSQEIRLDLLSFPGLPSLVTCTIAPREQTEREEPQTSACLRGGTGWEQVEKDRGQGTQGRWMVRDFTALDWAGMD